MKKINVLVLIGGICRESLNQRLYKEIQKCNSTEIEFNSFDIAQLPFFSQDMENNPPEIVESFKEKIRGADGILFITPEYNRSFPGVLKNAIDWASRPAGSNLWKEKPVGIIGASTGRIGTFGAQQHLRNVCSFLNMYVMHQPEFYFDASSSMNENGLVEGTEKYIDRYLMAFEQWIKRFNKE